MLNQPIAKRTIVWDNDTFDLKDEDPITPEPKSLSDIAIHPVSDFWKLDSLSHWKESVHDPPLNPFSIAGHRIRASSSPEKQSSLQPRSNERPSSLSR